MAPDDAAQAILGPGNGIRPINPPRCKMRKITLYRDDSTTQVVYENVKHFFWLANCTVLCIAQYTNIHTGEHQYIHWPRERFCWFKDEKVQVDDSQKF